MCLIHLLKQLGGLLIFECNYAIKDLPAISIFYRELLIWWSEFRDLFFEEKYWLSIIWNNKDIRINRKPVFYKTYYNSGVCTVYDLLLNLNNIDSFNVITKKNKKVNFLTWTGLRHSIPSNLKSAEHKFDSRLPYFKCNNVVFDISKKKSKDFYSLIVSRKAQLPNNAKKLRQNFNLTEEELKLAFALPHKVVYEPYVKAFQYKILNSILYTNKKLFKIGYSEHDKCTFCDNESETLHHLFFYCSFSNTFWKHFEKYYLMLTKKSRALSIQDVMLGIITSPCPLLNYLILIGKLYIWDCRRKGIHPYIEGFKQKIKINYQTEKYIASKNNDLLNFYNKWTESISL